MTFRIDIRWSRRCSLLCVTVIGVLCWLGFSAPAASAHAVVVSTTPSNGAEVSGPPREIRVVFDESVSLPPASDAAAVVDSSGDSVGNGSVRLADGARTLIIGLRTGLAKDTYIASWSVISADAHPVGGSIQFGYGVPAIAVDAPPVPEPNPTLGQLSGVLTGLVYLGLIIAFGMAPGARVLGAEHARLRTVSHVARIGAAVAALSSLAGLATQYLWDASALPNGPSGTGFASFATTSYAMAVYLRVVLLGVAAAVPISVGGGRRGFGRRVRWAAEAAVALGVAGTVVHNGHGGAGTWWRFALTLVHVLAMIGWIGGLAVLGWLLVRHGLTEERLRRLPLWSWYAAVSVALLVATGVLQSFIQVRFPDALLHTAYGEILIVKLVLVGVALVLALMNRRWVARALAARRAGGGKRAPVSWLRARVGIEAAVGAVIVLVAGVLSSTNPAVSAYAPTRTAHVVLGPYDVVVRVGPARRGPESFRVTAVASTSAAPPPQSIRLTLRQKGIGVRALPVDFGYRLPGTLHPGRPTAFTFVSSSVNVPATGIWTGTLTVDGGPDQPLAYVGQFSYQVL
ncbi:MAG: CopD family protein [Gordonia sp. (in: high G+C Gram-positive bacteria)]